MDVGARVAQVLEQRLDRGKLMALLRRTLKLGFSYVEAALSKIFPAEWNPMFNLGALGFFFYWIVAVSGIYEFIFFDTTVRGAFASIEYMTKDQWYAAGVMRSLHRYASDGLVLVMLIHLVREFAQDRYRGVRWFSWITGIPVLIMVYLAAISGYWLVWDKLAQYVAVVSTEWLDKPGIFGEPVARNFLYSEMLDDRFFTLMIFLHIAVPLIALIIMWVHLQRVTKPRINPPRGLAIGTLASMLALSFVHPALSQEPADLATVPTGIGLDWFYLPLFPLLNKWPGGATWGAAGAILLTLCAMPWLPPLRRAKPARVDLSNCNGCIRCFADCPYNAITMVPRTDGLPFERQPAVNPSLCTSCGICAGACPTAMPFRRHSELSAGIDLPDFDVASLRDTLHEVCAGLTGGTRILVFGCEHGPSLNEVKGESVGIITLRCAGQLSPSFIDYALSKNLAHGVVIAGCGENNCYYRFGVRWTADRLARRRDPYLRARVPAERLAVAWAGSLGKNAVARTVGELRARISGLTVHETAPAAETEEEQLDA